MADTELQKIVSEVKNGIIAVMNECKMPCRTIFATRAEDYVYKPYDEVRETFQYQRRKSSEGGIEDPDTYEVDIDEGELSMTITSNLKGNPEYAPPRNGSEGWDSGNITEIIEEGTGYHWRGSTIYKREPFPRPWMEKSGDEFVDTMLIPMIDMRVQQILGG
jgi:hypothetical protein